MNSKSFFAITSILITSLITGLPMAQSQEAAATITTSASPAISHYAEDLYSEYAAGADGTIAFNVQTLESGSTKSLAGKSFESLVIVPSYRIITDQFGTKLNNTRFYTPTDPSYGLHDMKYKADMFTQHGLPLEDGSYRRILVTASIGGDTRSHEAIEFCWTALNHCAVLDPVVVLLQSKVDTRLTLKAEGWGPRLTPQTTTENTDNVVVEATTCGLASHPSWIGETLTWAPWTAWAKDIFGITLWQENLAQQVAGITCNSSCHPQPFTTSSASSSFATLGYTTACANKGDYGVTGSTAKSIAQTDCTEKFAGQASVSVTIKGSGDGISLSWNLGGSGNSNGGVLVDSCGYH